MPVELAGSREFFQAEPGSAILLCCSARTPAGVTFAMVVCNLGPSQSRVSAERLNEFSLFEHVAYHNEPDSMAEVMRQRG